MSSILNIELLDSLMNQEHEPIAASVDWPDNVPDPRLTRSSYSSGLLFNGCERKYQLQKLSAIGSNSEDDWRSKLTFGFGHAVGEGIQNILMGKERNRIIFDLFCKWKEDLYAENEKQKKTFFHMMFAIDKFLAMRQDGFLDEYELVYYNGQPAAELSYRINFPDGFKERGYVDIVLRNKITGKFAIFEIKTNSGMYLQSSSYRNSGQATGYSIILDKIEPGQADYTVYYLVYMTRSMEWECFEFPKTRSMRAQWVIDKLHDFQRLKSLVDERGNLGIWPIRGNHCVSYGRECKYLGTCQLPTDRLIQPLTEDQIEETVNYTFEFEWEELIDA